jgi:hypothetical protein
MVKRAQVQNEPACFSGVSDPRSRQSANAQMCPSAKATKNERVNERGYCGVLSLCVYQASDHAGSRTTCEENTDESKE